MALGEIVPARYASRQSCNVEPNCIIVDPRLQYQANNEPTENGENWKKRGGTAAGNYNFEGLAPAEFTKMNFM